MLRCTLGLPGWVLVESAELAAGQWVPSRRAVQTVDGKNQISITPMTGRKQRFFRLPHD